MGSFPLHHPSPFHNSCDWPDFLSPAEAPPHQASAVTGEWLQDNRHVALLKTQACIQWDGSACVHLGKRGQDWGTWRTQDKLQSGPEQGCVCVCAGPRSSPCMVQLGREGGRGPIATSFLQTAKLGPISPKPAPVS